MIIDHKNKIPVLIFAVLTGVFIYILSNKYYLGFSPDSVSYFEIANSLKANNSITGLHGNLENHWPPGYPLFIFLLSEIFGISTMLAGTLGNALVSSLTILALFKIFNLYLIPPRVNYSLILLYLLSPIATIYLWYLSEGLFILIILCSFILFKKWATKPKIQFLSFCALMLGISVLVRYAGIGFLFGYSILIIYYHRQSFKNLLRHLFIFSLSFLTPIVPWFFYTRIQGIKSHDRKFDFELIPISKLQEMIMNFGTWVFGNMDGLIFMVLALIILLSIYFYKPSFFYNHTNSFKFQIKPFISPILLTAVYSAFILFSAFFLDHAIPLTNRMFSPVYPFFLLCLGLLFSFISRKFSFRLVYITIFLILISYSFRSIPIYLNHYENGSGFSSKNFRNSPTIQYVKQNFKENILYTNDIFLIKIFTENSHIKQLPLKEENTKLERLNTTIKDNNIVIVFLDSVNWRNYIVNKERLIETVDRGKILRFKDGIVITK